VIDTFAPFTVSATGEADEYRTPTHRFIRTFPGDMIMPAPKRVEVKDDSQLRLALALHREGANASSPYLGFFAFWSVFMPSSTASETMSMRL
jgi:hypothetical protein